MNTGGKSVAVEKKKCPNCGEFVTFKHMHDCAHGIAETHMAGTERHECPECEKRYFKSDGEQLGFIYVLD